MKSSISAGVILTSAAQAVAAKSLWLDTTPNSVMPYALLNGHGVPLGYGDTWNHFPVTGNSSGGAFCIMNTNGPGMPLAGGAGLFPHIHKKTYENFYAFKGRVQLWGQNVDGFYQNTTVQETRILGPGDFGAIPHNGIHTFNMLEPDTQLTGVLVPGGFEEFFFHMSSPNFDFNELSKWDVYPITNFTARTDVKNGAAGSGHWYDGPNFLPNSSVPPNFIAKNYGPKWLNSKYGYHQIVTPFVTGNQTDQVFAQGTITISRKLANQTAPATVSKRHTAFMIEEGQLNVTVSGYDSIRMIYGDTVFIPANTSFTYHGEAEFNKFMYVSGGGDGLDDVLIKGGKPTTSALFPADGPSTPFGPPGIGGSGSSFTFPPFPSATAGPKPPAQKFRVRI